MSPSDDRRRATALALLLAGAVSGIVMAGFGLLERKEELPANAVARVNDVLIGRGQFDDYRALINANSRSPKDPAFILDRMIDEELLVQRGVELGFLRRDNTVRNAMVQAVSRSITSGADLADPGIETLRAFFAKNRDYFASPPRYRVAVIIVADRRDTGTALPPFDVLAAQPATRTVPVPDALLPENKLIDYLGPAAVKAVRSLQPGQYKRISAAGNTQVVKLLEKRPARVPVFEDIQAQVYEEYLRRRSERQFREYMDWLRDRADVVTNEPAS